MKGLAIVIALALCVLTEPAAAEKRLALIIGNGAYPWGPLTNPANDARAMGQTLKSVGFDVAELENADQKTMKRAIQAFGMALRGAGTDAVGLFFYSGHGVQAHEQNFLIPVDAQIEGEADLDLEAVSAQSLLRQMEEAGNAVNIVVLDACRTNPFKRGFRAPVQGLARMDAPRGSLIAYATAPGDVASDGAGANSPFTAALIDAITAPGLKVEEVFKKVRIRVLQETGDKQTPWESSSLTGDLYFRAGAGAAPSPSSPAPAIADRDALFWSSIKDSAQSSDFDAYLQQFPQGVFAPLARNRLAALRGQANASGPSAEPPPVQPAASAVTGFILPDSDRRPLTAADVRGLDVARLRLARNEIYARRGRYFQDAALARYFSQFSWYRPTSWDPPLSAIEQANVDFLKKAEGAP